MKKIFSHSLITGLLCYLAPNVVAANHGSYHNPLRATLSVDNVPDFLLALVDLVFLVGTPIIVIFIIYAGFLFVTGGDNETKVAKAKFVLMWTLIGAMVLLGAKAIALAIEGTILSLA